MNVPYVVYDPATGEVLRSGRCREADLELQAREGEAVLVNAARVVVPDTTWVRAGRMEAGPSRAPAVDPLRARRDKMLLASDWTQLPDAPLTAAEKAEWAAYRQALRDAPEQKQRPFPTPPEKAKPERGRGR